MNSKCCQVPIHINMREVLSFQLKLFNLLCVFMLVIYFIVFLCLTSLQIVMDVCSSLDRKFLACCQHPPLLSSCHQLVGISLFWHCALSIIMCHFLIVIKSLCELSITHHFLVVVNLQYLLSIVNLVHIHYLQHLNLCRSSTLLLMKLVCSYLQFLNINNYQSQRQATT